ncbi:AraC family transcriptional regulator [Massilia eurypsychrophila]|uniref:AraC family transcriptional regulator n=1 Tax=Massilia eurypsychrophila TaxID=1485217 RepID=A0A2G8T9X6_9BURK|nr:AraC family transcriptional regulator [Massilia eurypsychrophila]
MPSGKPPSCPDPFERAPRASAGQTQFNESGASLRLAPPALQGALVALVARDICRLSLSDAQRLTHFPASPLVSISWFQSSDVGLIERGEHGPRWLSFNAQVVVAGSQSHPTATWAPTSGRGYMACFTADAAQALFEVELAAIQDRFVPVSQILSSKWTPLWEALLASDDADVMAVLTAHLAGPWQALQGRTSSEPSLRQLGRHWVERLAWKAQEWRRQQSPRHVERRIKSFSGRSMREWQALVRTEGLFFAARERFETGQPFGWAALAQDEGFADQAHMSRVAKRVTGFSPTEFADRFAEDESFWLYRLWV